MGYEAYEKNNYKLITKFKINYKGVVMQKLFYQNSFFKFQIFKLNFLGTFFICLFLHHLFLKIFLLLYCGVKFSKFFFSNEFVDLKTNKIFSNFFWKLMLNVKNFILFASFDHKYSMDNKNNFFSYSTKIIFLCSKFFLKYSIYAISKISIFKFVFLSEFFLI